MKRIIIIENYRIKAIKKYSQKIYQLIYKEMLFILTITKFSARLKHVFIIEIIAKLKLHV